MFVNYISHTTVIIQNTLHNTYAEKLTGSFHIRPSRKFNETKTKKEDLTKEHRKSQKSVRVFEGSLMSYGVKELF